jgi:hypothetical protein
VTKKIVGGNVAFSCAASTAFEDSTSDTGTVVPQVLLHISAEERQRLETHQRPGKHWKFDLLRRPGGPASSGGTQATLRALLLAVVDGGALVKDAPCNSPRCATP